MSTTAPPLVETRDLAVNYGGRCALRPTNLVFGQSESVAIVGRNGSGKSSALDAVQIAMMGANKNQMHFNAQADNKSHQQSRTLRSYCLGQYGDTIEQCARPQATTRGR